MRDVEIPSWLQRLPLAPEFRPTHTEFADPIAYISKIEKEASAFGVCKIIPPLPKPSKKYALHNLNRSLSKCPDLVPNAGICSPSNSGSGDKYDGSEVPAVFTTRQQELGQAAKKSRGSIQVQRPVVQKQVWQSGEVYTIEQFETKAKAFAKGLLSMVKEISPEVVESMFWKATFEKLIYIEYANDVPGSGFSEPEGSHRYFFKRRRKRIATPVSKKHEVDSARDSHSYENTVPMETEGTAGWKLSNSPWNLQVIARSPGSLTRFMPDDIPGVTSPMLYIGMLFSWFAWHVEDHELHSMNYLHTGSPKTWYAVPGDYAYEFEEVIRTRGYGGNIDRLAALKLLGEKTTLLSPEVVVASGIPCCRLVQQPGEFVVTFPRAYHIGFSHGFNCGEAANFGTPQWLEIAKEAAVRRAAMNFLPMLSHQQLLYLLTMSFFSRVPRSFLPGARSSRLRDRQKEEREKLVKKAFIQDIVKENKLSTILLARASAYRAVIWDPESLPSVGTAVNAPTKEIGTNVHSHDNESQQTNLFDEMSYLMETVNDLYLDDDDLSSDFQVNSGPLACVSCGILGFPFMSVVQPSERALMELTPKEYSLVQEGSTISKFINTYSSSDNGDIKSATSENISHVPDHFLQQEDVPSTTQFDKAWNASSGFLRPRIFCLEHAIQIEDLLRAKGGANVLVICHSDYPKMEAHTAAIVEEMKCPFRNSEARLDCASQGDLNLINLAIEEDKRGDECGEDWTSKLGINLRHCVKMRKNSSSPRIQHTLTLDGLFYDSNPPLTTYLKWQSKRSRTKFQLIHSDSMKPCQIIQIKDDKCREELDDGRIGKKENTILQYSRRKLKINSTSSAGVSTETNEKNEITLAEDLRSLPTTIPSVGIIEVQKGMEKKNVTDEVYTLINHSTSEGKCDLQTDGNVTKDNYTAKELCIGANIDDKIPHEIQTTISDPAQVSGSTYVSLTVSDTPIAALIDERFEAPQETCVAEDLCNGMTLDDKLLQDILTTKENCSKNLCNGMTDQARTVLCDRRSKAQQLTCALDTELKHEIQASNVSNEEPAQGVVVVKNQYISAVTGESSEVISPGPVEVSVEEIETGAEKNSNTGVEVCYSGEITEQTNTESNSVDCESNASGERKRKREVEKIIDDKLSYSSFFRSPCEGLRPRAKKDASTKSEQPVPKKTRKPSEETHVPLKGKKVNTKIHPHNCDLDSCRMRFKTKADLHMHKRNQCHHGECGKRFRSHKYTILHARVHDDERPLKCTWKGCMMSFKWAWARTEHLRVHTGERPYRCKVEECGLTFRYISDFSRHRRKTGHLVN